jgi:hypothetical protein
MIRHAWHFLNADWTTSSGNILVKVGEPLIHVGDLVPCSSGLHASTRAIDALSFARGPVVTLVECEDEFVDHGSPTDQFICRKRTAVWGYDCTDELWTFARLAALESLHLWPDAPAVVREFLETGNEDLLDAAWAAAWAAARDVARAAARAAAWAAALSRSNEILESLLIDGAVSRGLVLP